MRRLANFKTSSLMPPRSKLIHTLAESPRPSRLRIVPRPKVGCITAAPTPRPSAESSSSGNCESRVSMYRSFGGIRMNGSLGARGSGAIRRSEILFDLCQKARWPRLIALAIKLA